jgi:predicted AAA+ superfamily ATPase
MDTQSALGRPYNPRIIDALVTESLATAGAVLIEGPRGCGKTMTAMNAAASFVLLDDPDAVQLTQIAPEALLDGARPRLLDEWQLAPQLWNLVRRQVDAATAKGQFLLTGSSVPADDITRHTGAGRILRLNQRTLTWAEKQVSSLPGVSLAGLFDGQHPAADRASAMTFDEVVAQLMRPGFPAMGDLAPRQAFRLLRAYIDEIARTDLPRLVDVRHDPATIRQLIATLARSVSAEINYTTLTWDVRSVASTIKAETVAAYVGVLERLFVVERQPAWTPQLKTRARLRTSAKLHLADPALAAAALGLDETGAVPQPAPRDEADEPTNHLSVAAGISPDMARMLFESAAVHDLNVMAAPLDGEVRHYRDSNRHQIDAVVSLPDGRWGAIAVAFGGGQAGAAAQALNAAVAQVDFEAMGEPTFRLVLTATGHTFTMADGTATCPLKALRP